MMNFSGIPPILLDKEVGPPLLFILRECVKIKHYTETVVLPNAPEGGLSGKGGALSLQPGFAATEQWC